MTEYTLTYAQNREDRILKGFFADVSDGFYVDVGANHPRHDSVTRIFYEEGWRGINIEPNKHLYELLVKDRPEDINLQLGVSDKNGSLTFREYPDGDGLSTFSKEMQTHYERAKDAVTKKHKDYEVEVTTLKNIFEQQKVNRIDFMKVDVEGYEYEVLAGNDWEKYRPQILCIESNHIEHDWRPLLSKHGYRLVFFDGINDYYVAKESSALAEKFSYPQALLARPAIPYLYAESKQLADWQIDQLKQKITRHELVEQNLKDQIYQLNVQIQNQRRLRSLLKQLVSAINRIILLHIEKLNKVTARKEAALHITNPSDAQAVLHDLRQYDALAYYDARNSSPKTYRLIKWAYTGISRGIYKLLLSAFKTVKRASA